MFFNNQKKIQDEQSKGRITAFEKQFMRVYFDAMQLFTDQPAIFLIWSKAAEFLVKNANHLSANQKERILNMTSFARYTWYHFQQANDDPNSIWWKFHRSPMNPRDAIIPHLCLAAMLGYLDGKGIQSETVTSVVYVGVVVFVGEKMNACTPEEIQANGCTNDSSGENDPLCVPSCCWCIFRSVNEVIINGTIDK